MSPLTKPENSRVVGRHQPIRPQNTFGNHALVFVTIRMHICLMIRSILMLEHDDDDRYVTQSVFDENHFPVKLHFVNNSDDLFAFLISCEKMFLPYPALILLNHYAAPLNAIEILRDLKSNTRYAHIPVVVLSGTMNKEIVHNCYTMGANSFIQKPSSTQEINKKISTFIRYWFETVELP